MLLKRVKVNANNVIDIYKFYPKIISSHYYYYYYNIYQLLIDILIRPHNI